MNSISTSAVFTMLFIFSVQSKLSNAACVDTCAAENGECEAETCWCLAGKGSDNCATACASACGDGQVCTGATMTAPTCVECSTLAAPCENGGSCASKAADAAAYCRCTAGWTGDACQTDIDECTSNPCQNGATCNNGVNAYTCTCADGYAGTNCADVDQCTSNPCQNAGNCTSSADGYSCSCEEGYTGTNCENGASRIATTLPLVLAALFIFKLFN